MRVLLGILAALLMATSAEARHLRLQTPYIWTTAAQINAQAWDTSHAGTALNPAIKTSWSNVFHDGFTDATCANLVDEVTTNNGQSSFANWYVETVAEGGLAGTQFVSKATSTTNGLLTCTNAGLSITSKNVAGTWQGMRLKSHSYGDPTLTTGRILYGYWELKFSLPAPNGTSIPNCPTPVAWWFANWTINKAQSSSDQPWFEADNPETGVQSNDACHMQNTADYHTANTIYPAQLQTEIKTTNTIADALFDGQQHTLGELFSHDNIILYFDGLEIERMNISAMGDDMRQPNMLIVDMGLHDVVNTAYSATVTLYQADGWTAPAGSCYYKGGC